MIFLAVCVVVLAAVVAVVVATSSRTPTEDQARAWARRVGLRLTIDNDALAIDYLTETRRGRWRGALSGFTIALALRAVWPGHPGWAGNPLYLGVIGYVGALILGEARAQAVPRGDQRFASVEPRRMLDYLPGRLACSLLASTGLTIFVATWLVVSREAPTAGNVVVRTAVCGGRVWTSAHAALRIGPVVGGAAIVLLGTVAAGAVAFLAARRPLTFRSSDLIAADQAIRWTSASTAARAALGLALCNLAVQAAYLAQRWDVPCARHVGVNGAGIVAVVSVVAAVAVWAVPISRRTADDRDDREAARR